jgi:CheY-like chemotaxis protein
LIDDTADVRDLISRMLSASGYMVDVAATLDEARRLDPGGYDVLLIDAHLGQDRGTDLIVSLAAADPAAVDRCVVITGGSTGDLPDGVAVLAKPFDRAELMERVRAVPRREPGRSRRPRTAGDAAPGWREPAGTSHDARDGAAGPWQVIELINWLRAYDYGAVAELVHDGPAQELSAAILALELIRGSAPGDQRSRLDEVLAWLRSAASSLRGISEGSWTHRPGETALAEALRQRAALLLTEPLEVRTEGDLTALEASEEAAIVTVVELLLDVIASRRLRVQVKVTSDDRFITIDLAVYPGQGVGSGDGEPAQELTALDAAARALGGWADASPGEAGWLAHVVLRRRSAGSA